MRRRRSLRRATGSAQPSSPARCIPDRAIDARHLADPIVPRRSRDDCRLACHVQMRIVTAPGSTLGPRHGSPCVSVESSSLTRARRSAVLACTGRIGRPRRPADARRLAVEPLVEQAQHAALGLDERVDAGRLRVEVVGDGPLLASRAGTRAETSPDCARLIAERRRRPCRIELCRRGRVDSSQIAEEPRRRCPGSGDSATQSLVDTATVGRSRRTTRYGRSVPEAVVLVETRSSRPRDSERLRAARDRCRPSGMCRDDADVVVRSR